MNKHRIHSPCKGCKDRHPYCHVSCLEYKEFQDTTELIRQRRGEYQKTQEDYITVVTHRFRNK